MKEKILIASLEKIFELASQEFVCPTSSNLDSLSKEDIASLYSKVCFFLYDVQTIAYEAKESVRLLDTLNL